MYPKKRWGQNFLTDPNISNKIITLLNSKPSDNILEIGPGKGALTEYIKIGEIVAVEIDSELCEVLKNKKLKNLKTLNDDILKVNLNNIKFNKVVGNLPYNISSQIIFKLLNLHCWSKAIFMVQKELADRIVSKEGSKDYGRISIMIQSICSVKKEFNVSKNCFYPKPDVTSSIISLKRNNHINIDYKNLEDIVRISFSQRRKKIKNTLRDICNYKELEHFYEKRPEMISVKDFIKISKIIK